MVSEGMMEWCHIDPDVSILENLDGQRRMLAPAAKKKCQSSLLDPYIGTRCDSSTETIPILDSYFILSDLKGSAAFFFHESAVGLEGMRRILEPIQQPAAIRRFH
jgi:hypothetical protein